MMGHFGNNAIEMTKKRNSKPKQINVRLLKQFLNKIKNGMDNNNNNGKCQNNI
mgnify:CR=1 FL=1